MSRGVIRPLKTGGFSICYSPEDRVGLGRCRHIRNSMSLTIDVDNGTKMCCIGSEVIKNTDKDKVRNYLESLASVPEETKNKIIDFFDNL